jgi:hypothetical protein
MHASAMLFAQLLEEMVQDKNINADTELFDTQSRDAKSEVTWACGHQ